jgi:GR25 family glycosyltransferase involved in LPS biosynthesis
MTTLSEPLLDKSPRTDDLMGRPKNASVEIVIISMPTATSRRQKIESMFDGTGLSWSYFDAHTSLKHPDLTYELGEVKRQFGRTLSPPEIAVCSSHVALLSEFLQRGTAEHILVLEDDVIFDTDFPLDAFSAFCVENGIDYVRLFGKHYAKAVRLGFFFDRSIIRYTTSPAGAQAYLMSRAGARRFLDSYPSINATVDLAMDAFWTTRLPIYSIFPYPIIERYSPTSIPMPPYVKELSSRENLVWQRNRAITKASKISANVGLRKLDRQMMQRSWRFRQISDS